MGYVKYPASVKVIAIRMRTRRHSYRNIRSTIGQNISTRTFQRWMALFRKTKAVVRDPETYAQRGRPRVLNAHDHEFLKALVEHEPALFLSEIQARMREETGSTPSRATLDFELRHRLCLTLKKANVGNVRKSLLEKAAFIRDIAHIPAEFLVFTDETGIWDADLLRKRLRSRRGTRTTRMVSRVNSDRYSLVPAIGIGGLLAMKVFTKSVNRKRFERFLETRLLPRMNPYPGPNSVLVMDNAQIHHRGRVQKLCDRRGVLIKYLPRYSPELNPIELAFGILKDGWRRSQDLVNADDQVKEIQKATSRTFRAELMEKLYRSCGYTASID